MISIIIDNREKKIIDSLNQKKDSKNPINIEVKQLQLGDFQIFLEDTLIYIIERKSITDLLSSLNDGRYREQKMRVLSSIKTNPEFCNATYLYLLEGSINDLTQDLKKKYYGTLISLQLRDEITIFKTDSINESTDFLIRFL